MYIPEAFNITDDREVDATIVSVATDGLIASHVPVVASRKASGVVISGHLARANPHWAVMDGKAQAIMIFHGPHSYVSPIWYASGPAVPTWNYAVVHAYGRPLTREDPAFLEHVLRELLLDRYEVRRSETWKVEDLPVDYRRRQLARIVGFEMPVERLEAKFKLGQNRTPTDREGTLTGLDREGTVEAASLASFMRSYLKDG
jgi:transcriptional regulator